MADHHSVPLNIGLIVDSNLTSKYVYELADWAQDQNDINISHLIIQDIPKPPQDKLANAFNYIKKKGILPVAGNVLFNLIQKYERVLLN